MYTVYSGLFCCGYIIILNNPDSKVHGANMGPSWGRQDPAGPYVGHMNLAIWESKHGLIWLQPKHNKT